jgi:SAM-dependent methyltransferase
MEKIIYKSINEAVLVKVPKTTQRLLDVGCGSGALGGQIKQAINCEVVGVTYSESEAALAVEKLDQVLVNDLNSFAPEDIGLFDCIVCSHILEHLYQPQELLKRLHFSLTSAGVLIVALPNVLHWKQRLEFVRGRFKYTDGGLMDRTHFRFFDWETAHELLEESGYTIIDETADGNFPLPGIRKILSPAISLSIDYKAVKQFPGFWGFQFVFTCRSNLTSGASF